MSKLEVGKTYLTRDGEKVKLLGSTGEGHYLGVYKGVMTRYTEGGDTVFGFREADIIDMVHDEKAGQEDPGDSAEQTYVKALAKEERTYMQALANKVQYTPDEAANTPEDVPPAPLPNEELIQAVLAGKTVQWVRPGNPGVWEDLRNLAFAIRMLVGYDKVPNAAFRLKPTTHVLWGIVCKNNHGTWVTNGFRDIDHARASAKINDGATRKLLRLEVDDDLNAVDARTEAL